MTAAAEEIWHRRLRRRHDQLWGSARGRLLIHELLVIAANCPRRLERIDQDGRCHWQPMPPERGTPEFIERETRRVMSEMGSLVGIGSGPW